MTKPIKTLEQQIDEYKNDVRFKPYKNNYSGEIYKPSWNWDDAWDGQLIKDVLALEAAGFTVVSFSRKRKVTLKVEKNISVELADGSFVELHERTNIVELITYAVGDNWYSISFKPTLSIYWKGRSSSWNR